jgi:hypothetical protein
MKRWVGASLSVFLLSMVVWVGRAQAQTAATATVIGTVTDPTGAVVAGAKVALTNISTNSTLNTTANAAGQYTFPSVTPGTYRITATMTGFRTATVSELVVNVAKSYAVNFKLTVGQVNQTVQVQASVATALQTTNAQVGNVIGGGEMMKLPTLQHDAAELISLQPGVQPGGGAFPRPDVRAAGAMDDQNTYTLDGIDISDNLVGAGTWIPVPLDSVQEFDIGVNNPNSTAGRSSGAQVAMVARHGTNDYHGAVYWYHQNDNLNANTWQNNRAGIKQAELKDNRGGFRFGGPIFKNKTFFFANYELRRFPQSTDVSRIVPTDTLKQGILRFKDASGNIINYDLATAADCGSGGNLACDPRGLGLSPSVAAFWNLMPAGNDSSLGDGLNYVGFRATVSRPIQDDYGVFRLDHVFSPKWRFSGSYTYYRHITSGTQLDIRNGNVQSVNPGPVRTAMVTGQVTTQIRPTLINTFRFGWVRRWNGNNAVSPTASANILNIPGTSTSDGPIAINPAEDLLGAPIDNTSSNARFQDYFQKNVQFTDNIDWIKGNHSFQFGTDIRKLPLLTDRADKVVNGISSLVAVMSSGSFLNIPDANRPVICSSSVTTNCLASGDQAKWDSLYAGALGMIDNVSVLAVRDGSLSPLPFGTPLTNDTVQYATFFFGQDTWRLTNALTFTYGLSYGWQTAPSEKLGRQTLLINNTNGEFLTAPGYMKAKMDAAMQGQFFNPQLAYQPVNDAKKPVFNTDWGNLAPRVSVAWNPSITNGFLGRIFGDRKTVLRGGYSMVYARSSTIESVVIPMLGVGFGQTINVTLPACDASGTPGAGCVTSGNAGASVFRVGVDGSIPTPTVPSISSPVVPSTPFGELLSFQDDPHMKVGRTQNFDFTVQRELPGSMLLEVGWVGNWASRLPTSINLANAPYFFVDNASGQSFAQAFDAVATALRNGQTVTPQPWFENQMAGYTCGAATTPTGCLAAGSGSNFVFGNVSNLFQTMDLFRYGQNLPTFDNLQSSLQEMRTYIGTSVYNGMIVTLHKGTSHGLSFDLNYTFSKALDDGLVNQNNAGYYLNGFTPNVSWGPSIYDRTHVFTGSYVYNLPAGHGHLLHFNGWADKILSGWYTSGVYSAFTGLPLTVTESSQVWGGGTILSGSVGAIPTVDPNSISTSAHSGISSSPTGLNLFADPAAVIGDFRYVQISQDGRDGRANPLRGLGSWNLDVTLGKTTTIHENVKFDFSAQFLNIFNHVNFADPTLSLQNTSNFGVLSSEATPANRSTGARWIELGMRIEF